MENDTQEKKLIERNENNIFGKIKNFFKKIFGRKEKSIENSTNEILESEMEKSDIFKEYIKVSDNDGLDLLQLQSKYRRGEISDDDLTQEQIDSLCALYDRQIEDLKRTIEAKEQQLSKYKKKNKQKVEENNA